jgi:soluble lytic murein transglycosylase-like protein
MHVSGGPLVNRYIGLMRRMLWMVILCVPATAGEYAVLTSEARLKIDHHERAGDRIRLFTSKEGYIELPASTVAGFEAEEYVPPPPPAPPAVKETEPAVVKPQLTPRELVERAAVNNGLPPEFVHLVVRSESGYRQDAVSRKGAIGLMQLMPETAATLHADPHDAGQNVEAGTRYLRDLLVQYKDYPDQVRRALAAYNAGPGAVQRFNGVPPYPETQNYVQRIVDAYRKTLKQPVPQR